MARKGPIQAPVPEAGPPMALVLVRQGTGERCPVPTPEALVGRADAGEGIFPEPDLTRFEADVVSVSRRHARIRKQADGTFAIIDLKSSNGTQVGETVLSPATWHPLRVGDVVTFGRLAFDVGADHAG